MVRSARRLCDKRRTRLVRAHEVFAVAAAYGGAEYAPQMPDREVPRRLLALNRERVP